MTVAIGTRVHTTRTLRVDRLSLPRASPSQRPRPAGNVGQPHNRVVPAGVGPPATAEPVCGRHAGNWRGFGGQFRDAT